MASGLAAMSAEDDAAALLGTREIQLSRGRVAIVDAADYEWLSQWRWHVQYRRTKFQERWYAARTVRKEGKRWGVFMHRAIMGLGEDDQAQVDHRNRDGLDNRRENLRCSSAVQNRANAAGWSTTGYKGVRYLAHCPNNPWHAQIHVEGKPRGLGYFATAEQAARRYDEEAVALFGEFARLNFEIEAAA